MERAGSRHPKDERRQQAPIAGQAIAARPAHGFRGYRDCRLAFLGALTVGRVASGLMPR
jgi:hypothetical protein